MAPMLSILATTCAVLVGGASADPAPGKYFDKVLIMMFENVRCLSCALLCSLSVCLSVCLCLSLATTLQLADSRQLHLYHSTPRVR